MKIIARIWFGIPVLLASFAVAAACSSDSDTESPDGTGGTPSAGDAGSTGGSATGGGGSSGAATGGGGAVDPFNGDCSSAKWADVSDECWSCLCTACADTLNACDEDCTGVMTCGMDATCFVNEPDNLNCEVRCIAAQCLTTMPAQAAANAVIQFDGCLIGATKPSGFRVCEDVCSIPYTGDVCERYPQAMP